jgi:hypothetical protein
VAESTRSRKVFFGVTLCASWPSPCEALRMDRKFQRRQKEMARNQKAQAKRAERAARREKSGGAGGDSDIAAIQAALDAGLNPGSAAERTGLPDGEVEGEGDEADDGDEDRSNG